MLHSSDHRPTHLWEKVAESWCRVMHPAPMWPVNGHYRCPTCLRIYPVPWERQQPPTRAVTATPVHVIAQPTEMASRPPLGRAA